MEFSLKHQGGNLIAVAIIDGKQYEKDVTDYFMNANPHDDWLDYLLKFNKEVFN